MTDSIQTNEDTVLIAIDIAKHAHDALISWPSGRKKNLKVPNTPAGYQQLMSAAGITLSSQVTIAFEPTADFHRNIAYWFNSQGANGMLVSSLSAGHFILDAARHDATLL